MSELTTSILLHKREAERLFSGCVLVQEPANIIHDCGWLKPEQFHDERYRNFWQSIMDGKEKNEAAMAAGIYTDLLDAQNRIVSTMDYHAFARSIVEDERYLMFALKIPDMARCVVERNGIGLDMLMAELSEHKTLNGEAIPTAVDVGLEFCEIIGNAIDTITTGITDLDTRTGGFDRQTMTLFAARPGMGKSALLLNIAEHNARIGRKVLFVSLEMARKVLWARMACGYANLTWQRVRKGGLDYSETSLLKSENAKLIDELGTQLLIDDNSRRTIDDIWQSTAREKPDLVVIDHLALMADKSDNEVRRLGDISWGGKMIAKEFNCCVFFAQQLNRGTEERVNKRPLLSDLRDSGELEQNADQVVFLYREDYYNGNSLDISPTEVIVAKFRDGMVGSNNDFIVRR
jgi:KaiC/GvpD/RAD55 family RecA-like ATPase